MAERPRRFLVTIHVISLLSLSLSMIHGLPKQSTVAKRYATRFAWRVRWSGFLASTVAAGCHPLGIFSWVTVKRAPQNRIEAAESRFLAGRSRQSSADRLPVERDTAEGAGLATSRGRDAQPILRVLTGQGDPNG